jgi:OOP family OmpA-OmpF porin
MKVLTKWLPVALAAAAGFSALPAAAELNFGRIDTGLYLGAAVGRTEFRNACEGVAGSCDEKDFGGRGFVGWQFNRYIGVEFGYADLGKTETTTVPGAGISLDARAIDLVAVGTYPINEMFGVYGKLGAARTRLSLNGPAASAHDTSSNLTYGLGARVNFTRNIAARAEWPRYHDVGDIATTGSKQKIDFLSIGLLYGFY